MMRVCRLNELVLAIVTLPLIAARPCFAQDAEWKPVAGHIVTRWAADVSPVNAHSEYPRPQMVRDQWLSLNGLWDYSIAHDGEKNPPPRWDGKILVPFPVESALSGVGKTLERDQTLRYRRTFAVPPDWANPRILLHFGAVDWQTEVRVNGKPMGEHSGGYDPFSFDITSAINPPGTGENELIVIVHDPTDSAGQPRGKQVLKPESIWYTRTSGIWQSVWLEVVPNTYIESCSIRPDLGAQRVLVDITMSHPASVEGEVLASGQVVAKATAKSDTRLDIAIPNPHLWTPDDPYLYDLRLTLTDSDGQKDIVKCYFGMRDIRVGPDEHGVTRMLLNGKPLFQFGPLDQGFWPDGLYTAPTDAALKADVEAVRKMGCNMLRKHVKVEPERFYYWCDKLGVLVWQDMPSGNNPSDPPAARAEFEDELARIIKSRWNHPSIIMWVPFNEGWGQYDTPRIVDFVAKLDTTRLVNNASGWTDSGAGDVIDLHAYPGPGMLPPSAHPWRASVLGEFGGLGLPIENHTWAAKSNWGYVTYKNPAELTDAYIALIDKMHPLIAQGLSAAVYTQLSDVEIECNGWLTYDRAQYKIDPDRAAAATRKLYEPHGWVRTILATAAQATNEMPAATWRYTTQKPPDGWQKPDFDDSSWPQGPAGFGTKGTPGAVIGTQWNTSDIWIRRTFELATSDANDPHLAIHHDEDAEVYLNGELIAALKGYTTGYSLEALSPQAKSFLKKGRNTLAIHCHQTSGGQFIDAGLADMKPAK